VALNYAFFFDDGKCSKAIVNYFENSRINALS
jgi:hypothetical protein